MYVDDMLVKMAILDVISLFWWGSDSLGPLNAWVILEV